MRKHKSVVAILLAVMMIFTFMPTMAFADTTEAPKVVWAEDGSSVTLTFGSGATAKTGTLTKATINRYYRPQYGYVEPYVSYGTNVNRDTLSEVEKMAYDYLGDFHKPVNLDGYHYYDLDFAKVTNANDYTEYTYDQFDSEYYDSETGRIWNQIHVYLSAPTYVKNYEEVKNANPVRLVDETLVDETLAEAIYASGFTKNSYTDMSVTLSATVLPRTTPGQQGTYTRYVGSVKENTVTVKGKVGTAADVKFDIDKITKESTGTFPTSDTYDGQEHAIVTNEVPGISVAYQIWNNTSKKWEDKTAITYKDATSMTVRYKIYKTSEGADSVNWVQKNFEVSSVGSVRTVFDKESYEISGTEFDPWDFVVVMTTSGEDTDKYKAVAADNDALKAAAKEYFDLTQTADKYDPTVISLKIAPKKDLDREAFYKAHKALFDNFYGEYTFDNYGQKTATVYTNVGAKDDDISFEGQTKYVYSGKMTTKKGVLKKKQTITITAAADSGKDITYVSTKKADGKIIVSTSGKITVKKGLKKGTYTVTVKAKTKAGYGYKAAKEKQTYTIVVKK